MNEKPQRLLSLDILRGFDLFLLVVLCPLLLGLKIDAPWYEALVVQFTHAQWEGFRLWDLVMPLFMFMSGVTIPFALAKYRNESAPRAEFYKRLVKRVLLLWLLGMLVQGNLLSLSPAHFKFYSNTLQAIATGYLFACLAFIYISKRSCVVLSVVLLAAYWAIMHFATGGDYGATTNLAYRIDTSILGQYMDGASIDAMGVVNFSAGYHYAWILPSLNFVVTVMSGMFAGMLLRDKDMSGARKALLMAVLGATCVALGWMLDWLLIPVIKPIWTSSMVLVSSGYCFLLLALFYYVIDIRGYSKGLNWLRIYGLNSIVAYVLTETFIFSGLSNSIFWGLKQYVGDYYHLCIECSNILIIFAILYILYRNNKFLRV